MTLDNALLGEGAALTVIGVATAFGVLLLLMLAIVTIGSFAARVRNTKALPASDGADQETRDKALAAVIAVSALMEQAPEAEDAAPR